ncbi:MAG: response regulator [Lachnospiraceae bacterium]|nr:response regulator [Lachnospiraceae bacterium]
MKILLAEDDSKISQFVAMSLADYVSCDVAKNGEEAIDLYALKASKKDAYDICFIDFIMPGINGFDTIKHIRELESDKNLHRSDIYIMTSMPEADWGLDGLCDGFIKKPVNISEIIELIKTLE